MNLAQTGFTLDEIGHHTSDLNLGRSAIFVYCDILEAGRVVGNTITKLLSVIPVIGSHGSTAYFQPNFIEYCNLAYDNLILGKFVLLFI